MEIIVAFGAGVIIGVVGLSVFAVCYANRDKK